MSDILTEAIAALTAPDAFWLNEAAGIRLRATSYNRMRELVGAAIREQYTPNPKPSDFYGPYVQDFYGDAAIFEWQGHTYEMPFTYDEAASKVALGTAVEVQIAYVPVTAQATEAALDLGIAELVEAAKDGSTATIKVIGPQWGSSGYYGKDMLKRDAGVFSEGTHMYIDHPGKNDRPERSIRDLAAVTTGPAVWQEAGSKGPGLYAPARILKSYQGLIKEAAADIGVSIRASGKVRHGEAEGKKGPIVEAITGVASVDFVTKPGAGGAVAELFESARQRAWETEPEGKPMAELTEAEREALASIPTLVESVKVLTEANKAKDAELGKLRTGNLLREARDVASLTVGKSALPEAAKSRLIESLANGVLPQTDAGELDREKFTEAITAAVTDMAEFLGKVSGPVIRNMGASGQFQEAKPLTADERVAQLKETGKALGLRGAELERFATVEV